MSLVKLITVCLKVALSGNPSRHNCKSKPSSSSISSIFLACVKTDIGQELKWVRILRNITGYCHWSQILLEKCALIIVIKVFHSCFFLWNSLLKLVKNFYVVFLSFQLTLYLFFKTLAALLHPDRNVISQPDYSIGVALGHIVFWLTEHVRFVVVYRRLNPEVGWKCVSEWGGDISIQRPSPNHASVQGGLQGKGQRESRRCVWKHRNCEVLGEKSSLCPSTGLSCEKACYCSVFPMFVISLNLGLLMKAGVTFGLKKYPFAFTWS